ncbi:TonB-dependent receptor [Dyella silvatica]|uniref:TonB-dependent receptor n=1 Tax=Dyella silvatica TaxID=2992128 RepID=UPI00224FC377|nr:TonB-dependent receptor [Dyella silvatica]
MSQRKTLLAASIVVGLCLSVAVQAQDQSQSNGDATTPRPAAGKTQANKDQAKQLEGVTVTGIRASLAKSIDTKRNASAVVEAITAEDIGKFPSTNVAEAISQIPGVTIDRRFGQGERVSIDGTDPSLNLTFLDGHPVAQTPWLLGEQPNRGFDYTQLAPEILGRLEVYKSPEARLPEGSIGGTVIMHTRQPFDLAPNTISGSVGTVYNDQAGRGRPNASVLYSWHNPESTFGVTTSVAHYEEQVDRQGIEIFGYSPVSDLITNPHVAAQVANGQIKSSDQMAQEVNGAYFQQHRQRDSVTLGMQWKPIDRLQFDLNGLYVRENFQNSNQSLYAITSDHIQGITGLTSNGSGQITGGHSCGINNPGCPDHAITILDENVRKSVVTTKGLDLKGEYKGDSWALSGQGGFSNSGNPNASAALYSPRYYGGYTWDVNKGLHFDDPAAARNPANWNLDNNSYYTRTPAHTRDVYGQLDFSKDFDSVFNQLLTGVRYTKHTESSSWLRYYVPTSANGTTAASVGGVGYTNDIFDAFSGMSPDYRNHIQADPDVARNWVIGQTLGNGVAPDPSTYLNNTWNLTQKAEAAYAQLNFANDNWHGNVGLRYVHTKINSLGYEAGADASLPPPPGSAQLSSRTFNDFLPSINVVYDTNNSVVFRASAAKVIAWAPYNQLVNNTSLVDDQLTGSGGNNKLDPYKSYNFNASVEWYFNEQSMLALSLFYKHIQNYIETDALIERQFNSLFGSDTYTALAARPPTPGRQGNCDSHGFCDYSVLRPANGGAASVKGFTVSYQQPFGDSGFGVAANYTYSHGKSQSGQDLPYNSTSAANVSPYFEKGAFTARINYGWRGRYLAGGYVAGAPPASVDSYTNVSASLGWQFNENFSLSLDGMNLLNEKYYQFDRESNRAWNNYSTGRRYLASVHFKF